MSARRTPAAASGSPSFQYYSFNFGCAATCDLHKSRSPRMLIAHVLRHPLCAGGLQSLPWLQQCALDASRCAVCR